MAQEEIDWSQYEEQEEPDYMGEHFTPTPLIENIPEEPAPYEGYRGGAEADLGTLYNWLKLTPTGRDKYTSGNYPAGMESYMFDAGAGYEYFAPPTGRYLREGKMAETGMPHYPIDFAGLGGMDFSDLFIDHRTGEPIGRGESGYGNIREILKFGSPMHAMTQRFLRSPEMLSLIPDENLREQIIMGDFTYKDIHKIIPKEYLNLPDANFPVMDYTKHFEDYDTDTQLKTTLGLVADYDKTKGFVNWAKDMGLDPEIASQWQNVFSELHRGWTETYLGKAGFDVSNPGMEGMIFDEQTGTLMDWQEKALRDDPEDAMNILGYNLFEDHQIMNEMKTLDEVDLNEFPEE